MANETKSGKTGILTKLIVAVVVAVGVAVAGYFGLDITSEDIETAITPIIENVLGDSEEAVPAEETPGIESPEEMDVLPGAGGETTPPVPAEEPAQPTVGEKVDEALDAAEEAASDVGEAAGDAAEAVGDAIDKATK